MSMTRAMGACAWVALLGAACAVGEAENVTAIRAAIEETHVGGNDPGGGDDECSDVDEGRCTCPIDQIDPDDLGPAPNDAFECPFCDMDYCAMWQTHCPTCRGHENDNPNHFDCDDFAYACQIWGWMQGINTCQMTYGGVRDPARPVREKVCMGEDCDRPFTNGSTGLMWHAINIVELATQYCLIEPQVGEHCEERSNIIACWPKDEGGITDVPDDALKAACRSIGMLDDHRCQIRRTWCDLRHSPSAGEKSFVTRPEICAAMGECAFDPWDVDLPIPECAPTHCPDEPESGPYPEPTCPCDSSFAYCQCGGDCTHRVTGKGLERKQECVEYCQQNPVD